MINHANNASASYEYCDQMKGFCLLASSDLPEYAEIFGDYGSFKANKKMFNNYGFFEDHQSSKVAMFPLGLHEDDKFLEQKTKLLASNSRSYDFEARHTLNSIEEQKSFDMIQFARFVCIDDTQGMEHAKKTKQELIEYEQKRRAKASANSEFYDSLFTGRDMKPFSIDNEKKTWAYIKSLAINMLGLYPTTLEEDKKILEKDDEASEG